METSSERHDTVALGKAVTGCLTDEVLLDVFERRLSPEALAGINRHVAECPACRVLLVELARGVAPVDEADTVPSPNVARIARQASTPGHATGVWAPPIEFDEFRLLRVLGRGGMGVVYLVRDTSLDRLVAIKFIASRQPSQTARTRFLTEARAIARLKHPNVVTVFRVGEVAGLPYLVSEYVPGQRLDDLARPMPWRRVLGIGRSLARGLGAAHRQGVLHRDIKPGNVIMTSDGDVKLLDFGLAELLDQVVSSKEPRTISGTPRYMAPEVLKGAPSTSQSDLYALGLLLYELCTGYVPRRGRPAPRGAESSGPAGVAATDADPQAAARPKRPDAGPLAEVVPGIDPDFAAVVECCLRIDPDERLASVDLLYEELDRLDRARMAQPLPAGNPYRGLHPFEAEHRALFFGRDGDVRAVLERLKREPLILIAGDSGAGKSSLCHAGVLPRVAEGALDEQRRFSVITLCPGRRPLAALAAALAPVLSRREAELGAALAPLHGDGSDGGDGDGGVDGAWLGQELREGHKRGRSVFLFIDQLEELLTLSDPAEATRFSEILAELALPSPGVRVLLAVRGDYLTRLAALPGLGEGLQRALYLLRPLSPEGMREAIVGPARSQQVVFESEALIATLMASTAEGAGSLPLLQFALAELWERRDRSSGRITRAALDAMGGVAGALSRHADGVLARLGPAERQAARRALVRLVTAEGTRVARSEAELGIADEPARVAVRGLVEGRLLYTRPSIETNAVTEASEGPMFQIAHEALIESWGTLRGWLDEDIGHRALRQRVEAAGAEWERLGRAGEVLWSTRHLDEVRPLDPEALGPRERAFLAASRRAVRRRRALGVLSVFAMPLLVGAIYGGVRLQAHRASERFIAGLVGTAQAAADEARGHAAQALARREAAMILFDGRGHAASGGRAAGSWDEAERVWAEALEERAQANAAYTRADHALATALLRDSSHRDARERLAELTYERVVLADHFHEVQQRGELVRLLERLDEQGRWRQRLEAPAELRLETVPAGARVTLARYVDDHGRRRLESVPGLGELGTTPVARALLPPGSYLLRFTWPGRVPVDLPLKAEAGERREVRVPLPATVPAGYAYVPPGCFLFGSGDVENVRQFMQSLPIHRVCLGEGYLIARTEVTVSDWLAYLDALPEGAAARRLLAEPHRLGEGVLLLRQEPGAGWTYDFSMSPGRGAWPAAHLGEPFSYAGRSRRASQDWRRFPVAGVSPEEFEGYLGWLDRSGRLPGARLCTEEEWERAARGADDRIYPHGDGLLPDDANIDVTYGQQPEAYGPDEVGAHPASASPFGVMDMAGNVLELTRSIRSEPGRLVMRGGAWYYDRVGALIVNRTFAEPTMHDARVGARACASVAGK